MKSSQNRQTCKSVEWYTPPEIVEAARLTMGSIDLDPASCEYANRMIGTRFYSKEDDGLSRPWYGNVFLNLPGGRAANNQSSVKVWWNKLQEEVSSRRVKQAVFLGFSIDCLQVLQAGVERLTPLDYSFCVPSSRLKCYNSERSGKRSSPPHASVVIYLGDRRQEFIKFFSHIGNVVV